MDRRRDNFEEDNNSDRLYFLVAKIDERTRTIKDIQAEIKVDTATKFDQITTELREGYVKNETFDPIKKLFYGLVSLILASILVAGLTLMLKK